jgi:3-vinyl bacteriochlorophyllide hydratase
MQFNALFFVYDFQWVRQEGPGDKDSEMCKVKLTHATLGVRFNPEASLGDQTMARPTQRQPLYTPDQKARRDASVWTLVQGILAPVQFVIFLISVILVMRYITTGEGYGAATVSVLLKTAALYLIMVTGAIWEKAIFGQYLFAPGFFWEDVVSFVVIGLHTLYLYGLVTGSIAPLTLMYITLAAYITYVVNAGQFLWKLRVARMQTGVAA